MVVGSKDQTPTAKPQGGSASQTVMASVTIVYQIIILWLASNLRTLPLEAHGPICFDCPSLSHRRQDNPYMCCSNLMKSFTEEFLRMVPGCGISQAA